MRLLILIVFTFETLQSFSQQNLENLKILTSYNWEISGQDSTLNTIPVKEMSFHSGFIKLDSGSFKGWFYGEEGVMSHRIENNVRTSYSLFKYLIKSDSLQLIVTLRTKDLEGQPLVYKMKQRIDAKGNKLTLVLPKNKNLFFEGSKPRSN